MSDTENLTTFEKLKILEAKKVRLEEFFKNDIGGYDYVVLSKKTFKNRPFYEQDRSTKRTMGAMQMLDVPDIKLEEVVKRAIEDEYKRICKEFADLQKDL